MKKLKKSVKAIVISLSIAVVAIGVVLGVVFGLKNNGGMPPLPPMPKPPTDQSYDYSILASDIRAGQSFAKNSILDDKVYGDYCDYENIKTFGKTYFSYIDSVTGKEVVYHYTKKTDGTYAYTNITSVPTADTLGFIEEDAQDYKVVEITDKYVVLENVYKKQGTIVLNAKYSIIYIAGNEPVEVYLVEDKTSTFFFVEAFHINDSMFAYTVQTATGFNIYINKLSNGIAVDDEKAFVVENFSFDGGNSYEIELFNNGFVYQTNEGLKIGRWSNDSFVYVDKTFTSTETELSRKYSFTKISDSILLIEEKTEIVPEIATQNTVIESTKLFNYSYSIIVLNREFNNDVTIPLSADGGKYTGLYVSNNSTHIYLCEQKLENNLLVDKFVSKYFTDIGSLILEYESEINEKVVYSDGEYFLTENRSFRVADNVAIGEFVFADHGNIEIAQSNVTTNTFTYQVGTEYGIMSVDGSVVDIVDVEGNKILFTKIFPVNSDYAIGYCEIYDKNIYYAICLTKEKDETGLNFGEATRIANYYNEDSNLDVLLSYGSNISYVMDSDDDKFYLYEDSRKVEDVKFTTWKYSENLNKGVLIEFYDGTTLVKLIHVDVDAELKFTNEDGSTFAVQKFAKKVEPYFHSQTIYIKDTSTKIGKLEVYQHTMTGTTVVAGNWYDDALKITMEYGYYILEMTFTVDFVNKKSYTVKSTMSSPSSLSDNGSSNNNSHPFNMFINDSGCVVYDWTTKNGYYPYADVEFPDGDEYLSEGASSDGYDRFVFTLSFDTNGGSSISSQTIEYGKSYTKASNFTGVPTKTGYTFSKWTTGNSSTTAVTSFTCSGNKTLYAQYTANVYNVNYTLNGGTSGSKAPDTATYDEWFQVSHPTKTGYTFVSWKLTDMDDGSSVTHYYGTSTSSYETTTSTTLNSTTATYFKNLDYGQNYNVYFEASWTPIVYNVYYTLNGGTAGTNAPATAKYDEWFQVSHPTRTGYTFASWKLTNMDNGSTITHYYGTGTSTGKYETTTSSTLNSTTATYFKNLDYKQGYSVYFEASWTPNKYSITYSLNGGTSGSYAPTSNISFDEWIQVSNPTKTGYIFSKWTVSGMGTTGVSHYYGSSSSNYNQTTDASKDVGKSTYFRYLESDQGGSVTFTASWTPITYFIHYTYNGGGAGTNAPDTGTYDSWVEISHPVRVGYTFKSWRITDMDNGSTITHYYGTGTSTGSYQTTTSLSIEETAATYFKNLDYCQDYNVYFEAAWTANEYYIQYDAGGGTMGDKKPAKATFDQWFSISVPSSAPQGYYFDGWIISDMTTNCDHYYGSSTSDYTSNKLATHTVTTTDLYFKNLHSGSLSTVYTVVIAVKWTPYTYAVSYDLKGGTHGTTHPSRATYDATFEVSDPTRSGYTFNGWSFNGLNDVCTHYYYNSANAETAFTSTNGRYPDAVNPNYDTIVKVRKFKNLDINGSAVLLVANWIANSYTITYYYLPETFDTSAVTIDTLNNAGNMTASKTQTVVFDMNFTTYKPSNSGANDNEFPLPNGVRADCWVVSTTQLSSSTSVVSWSGDVASPSTGVYYAFDTDYIYGTYAQNIYCYAAYIYSDITVKYYTATSADNRNNLAGYTYHATDSAKYNMIYTTKSLSGVVGWMISANHYIAGSMSPQSYSVFTFRGTTYSATCGTQIWWVYSNTNAYNFDDPVYYAYAVYSVNGIYTLTPPAEEEVDVVENEVTTFENKIQTEETVESVCETSDLVSKTAAVLVLPQEYKIVIKEEYINPKDIEMIV